MSGNDDTWNEERLEAIFAAASGEAPAPDEEFLRLLREKSAAVFAASHVTQPKRKSKMLFYISRIAAAAAAASIAVAGWFFAAGPAGQAHNLGHALDKLAAAGTLHLRVMLDGKATEAWARQPGLLRWNLSDGIYQIARGDRSWLVDEKANRAAQKTAAFFLGEKQALDIVRFLLSVNLAGQIDDSSRRAVSAAKPTKREMRNGAECDLYEINIPSAAGPVVIEAVVDCTTGLPITLGAKTGRDRKFTSLAAIEVLAVDAPVSEELFVVGDTLTEDGRIGKVTDAQGTCAIRPAMAERWTPLSEGTLAMPGDWLRTDLRGANAAAVRLIGQTQLTVGPGSLVELVSPKLLRVFTGDVKIAASERSPLGVAGPDKQAVAVKGMQLFRIEKDKLVRLEKDPLWLKGFEGHVVGESIGSLVANIDGRNTPLTVGYHKVTVDIRDQIARTTIEESFVNHTDGRLEGAFHFPLPQDASISGFGMWIGSELVEADVVEKQRAREIYETILRERRDPGLLEWSGGNIFKARVFPIEANSEKRIKISYTQVLPRRGNGFCYSYALQSELLKQHPLRELTIDVKLNSAAALRNVTSPTHQVRVQQTAHSARVEFAAQEYAPTRDFEVTAELDNRQSELELIPHRRGDDGYFMAILTPPEFQTVEEKGTGAFFRIGPTDASQKRSQSSFPPSRDVLPEGGSLDLLILADTSASLDRSARTAQGELIAALLGSLTPKDRINLACCDVECDWVFEKSAPAEAKNIDAMRNFLGKRVSLGWTDLEKAFSSAFSKAGAKTRVLYVGDGIVTTGDADPVAFGKRLRQMYHEQPKRESQSPTCYAVSVGSSFEAAALKAIASCGGGSVRQIGGEHGPQAVARDLLQEIARPAFKDLKIEFRGLQVARVYPEELPNLPAGGQQIILGRYLPTGKDQSGEVIVTGTFDGRPIRYSSRVSLNDAEQGNSFIPRLWARMHLDYLLQQGASQSIQDEIIALSEEYHIMTPYTSLLVLENDADRKRFKVKRLFAMRDGERFFAAGRDNVNYDLTQQQMRRAGLWRLGLRRSVLAQLSGLGRDASLFARAQRERLEDESGVDAPSSRSFVLSGRLMGSAGQRSIMFGVGSNADSGPAGNIMADADSSAESFENGGDDKQLGSLGNKLLGIESSDVHEPPRDDAEPIEQQPLHGSEKRKAEAAIGRETQSLMMMVHPRIIIETEEEEKLGISSDESLKQCAPAGEPAAEAYDADDGPESGRSAKDRIGYGGFDNGRDFENRIGLITQTIRPQSWNESYCGDWLGGLFPYLPAPPAKVEIKEPKNAWPNEANAIAASLLREDVLRKVQGGMRIQRQSESFEPRFAELTSRNSKLALTSPMAWLTRDENSNGQTMLNWCDGKERGAIASALQLGRLRTAQPVDADLELRAVGLGLDGWMLTPLNQCFRETSVELKPRGENRVLLRITYPAHPEIETRFLIDTARHVVLSSEYWSDGKATSTTKYDGFVQVAGVWWPGHIETFDAKGRRVSLETQQFTVLTAHALTTEIQRQLAGRDSVQFLHDPLPKLLDAKRAFAAGKASFDDQFVLLDHFARSQQWTRAMDHLAGAEKLATNKPGMRWLRASMLNISRRREELKTRIMEEAAAGSLSRWERARVRAGEDEGRKPDAPSPPASLPKGEGSNGDELFLANRLMNQVGPGILQANEMLRLLDALKPLYQRQPAFTQAMKRWRQQQVNYLRSTGQAQEALNLQKQLATDFPHDSELLQQYANALAQIGEHEAAYRLLLEALGGKIEWHPYEEESLRSTYCQLMESQGRWVELADFLGTWIKRNPEMSSPYEQYLGALVRLDKIEEVNALAAKWLAEGQMSRPASSDMSRDTAHTLGGTAGLSSSAGNTVGQANRATLASPAASARLEAAVGFMLGNCYGIYMERIDERWLRLLADAAIFFARHETQGHISDRIMGDGRFTQSDECRRVRRWAIETLLGKMEKLKPAEIQRFVTWAMSNDPVVEQPTWRTIAQRLRKLWDEKKKLERGQLTPPLAQILSSRLTPDEWIAFLRVQWREALPENRANDARQLFDTLIAQPWSQAGEDEAFALLERLSEGQKEPVARLAIQIGALYRLTDRMVDSRYQAKMKAVEHPEKLTRIELRTKQTENRKTACEGFADRLRQETAKRAGPLVAWLNAERVYCDVSAGRNLDKAAEECWEFLGPTPEKRIIIQEQEDEEEATVAEDNAQCVLDRVLQSRFVTTLANLAARKNAPPGTADRLLKYVDAGIAAADKDDLKWKTVNYQLLVALDRPKELEQALREWAASDGPVNRWRLSLGYLLAEQGKLTEAIALFEAVAAADELGPAEHRTLADWYMAVGRRESHEKSMIDAYKTIEEWQLNNLLSQRLQPWQRRDVQVPTELDKEVLLIFTALLEKSPNPQGHLWLLQQYYRETHDFRLLACLADSVTGHTAGQAYPLLQNVSSVLDEVRDEATADALVEQITKVRRQAKTDVDRRALDLLEAMVERRAAELINQPGPHVAKAVAALQRAFKRQWTAGEPPLMADFLANLGNISMSRPQLAEEQVRQLETLYREAAPGTVDRLSIAKGLANARWHYFRQDAAIDLLQLELNDYQRANHGVLLADANEALGTLVSFFEQRRHYARGEEVLFEQLKHPLNAQQKAWLVDRLYDLYVNAINNDGDVSLGRRQTLFRAAAARIEGDMATATPDYRYQLLNRLCEVYRAAHEKKFEAVADDLRAFALQRFSAVIKQEVNNRSSMVNQVAQTLHDVAGPRDGLAFLVEQIEREPRWLRYNNQDGWQQHGWTLAQWRLEAKQLGDLEPRLLKIVLYELRKELQTRRSRNNCFYRHGNGCYWADKEKDFAQVAEEIYAERKNSGAAVACLAEYLYNGLGHYDRAIEMMLTAHRKGLLDETAQLSLVQYLHGRSRYGESIAILLPLVECRPDNVWYRRCLMRAYFFTKQPAELLAFLKESDEHFRKDGRWTEGNIAGLAESCLENQLFEQSVAYYRELIPMFQRARPNRGIGDNTLSRHYRKLAAAFIGLKNTAEVVEAACGAIVGWGPRNNNRADALNTLRKALVQSPNLDAYVRDLDKKTAETGLDNPLVRKALGQAYLGKGKLDKAKAQLKLAVELQPNDAETLQALLTCCDQVGDREGAAQQLLQSVELSRRDIKLYEDLGRRYAALNRPGEAERAYTSIVEMLANESESHAALAEIRQQQNRWDEAIREWRQVARLRVLEPTGLAKLADAQIHQKRWDDADASVLKLQSRTWPSRFSDVQQQIWQLRQKIEQGRKGQ